MGGGLRPQCSQGLPWRSASPLRRVHFTITARPRQLGVFSIKHSGSADLPFSAAAENGSYFLQSSMAASAALAASDVYTSAPISSQKLWVIGAPPTMIFT